MCDASCANPCRGDFLILFRGGVSSKKSKLRFSELRFVRIPADAFVSPATLAAARDVYVYHTIIYNFINASACD